MSRHSFTHCSRFNMYILGISAFYHDSAACLIKDGVILAAAQEERFSRLKHDSSFPKQAISYCLNYSGVEAQKVDKVVFYEKPFLKFERLLETYLAFAPRGFVSFSKAMPEWIKNKLFQKTIIAKELSVTLDDNIDWSARLLFSDHHLSHAASAFYPSPFDEAATLTLDGVGEWATTSMGLGSGNKLDILKEIKFPHSLGLLYSAFTYYTGFKVNSGEYKVMGLAPYGIPKYANLIRNNLIHIANDGSFQLDMSYFDFATGLTMTNKKFNELFGGEPRKPETSLSQREMDLAASVQEVTEEIVLSLAKGAARETESKNLCLAGGVALNCVANGILQKEKVFENLWIQPAAGDAGGALGAALAVWYMEFNGERKPEFMPSNMKGSLLGPEFTDDEVVRQLEDCGAKYTLYEFNDVVEITANAIADGQAVGWMQGRMEFGPRALGARSILADPRSSEMQKQLNLKVKFRESFRPFAPSIIEEDLGEWFDLDCESPYMLLVAPISAEKRVETSSEGEALFGIDKLNVTRSQVPAVTHVDCSARIQTVNSIFNPAYYKLLTRFKELTGCPILVNTSFNVRGEPIVCTPRDAFRCFMGTDLDMLIIGRAVLFKNKQDRRSERSYVEQYELD